MSWKAGVCALVTGCILLSSDALADDAAKVERLEQEVADLRARLQRLERLMQAQGASGSGPGVPGAAASNSGEPVQESVLGLARASELEAESVSADPDPEPGVRIGGALRFNHYFREDVSDSRVRRGESGFDLFRLNVDGELSDIIISAEYRLTPNMDSVHHGWLGYRFDDGSTVKVGIHQVPFGLLPYAAHNYWFGVPHYAGFSDNHDLGVLYQRSDGALDTHLAFYKNEELGSPSTLNRYAPDPVFNDAARGNNEDINRANARLAYTLGQGTGCEHELGLSGQYGELYNQDTRRRGDHWAAAAHLDSRCGRWNVQLQGIRYDYDARNPTGVRDDVIQLGAYGTSYGLVAEGTLTSANLAYNFEPPFAVLDQLICYNDYSRLYKDGRGFRDTEINTLGCGMGVGPVFTYVDLILARNMLFFGNGSLAEGGEDRWRSRFNINLGFYW